MPSAGIEHYMFSPRVWIFLLAPLEKYLKQASIPCSRSLTRTDARSGIFALLKCPRQELNLH